MPYDPQSIMHYKFSGGVLKSSRGACAGEPPLALSAGDKMRIALLYPQSRERQEKLIETQTSTILKLIQEIPDTSRSAQERLARESERLVSLGHPDIVFRVDVGGGADWQVSPLTGRERRSLEALALGDSIDVARLCRPNGNLENRSLRQLPR